MPSALGLVCLSIAALLSPNHNFHHSYCETQRFPDQKLSSPIFACRSFVRPSRIGDISTLTLLYDVLDHTNQIFSLNIAQCSLSIWPNSTDDWSHSQLAPSLRSHSQLVFHSTGPHSTASFQLVPHAPGPRINWSLQSTSPHVIVYWSPSQLVHYWVWHAKCNWSSFEKQRIQTNTNTMPQFV